LFGDFCQAFEAADRLLLTEIYPASEKPIPGVNGQSLAQGIRQISKTDVAYFQDIDAIVAALPEIVRPGDVLLTLGAGNITTVGPRFLDGART
jgi:UDP-N-acetylmuramate--alanine ligase